MAQRHVGEGTAEGEPSVCVTNKSIEQHTFVSHENVQLNLILAARPHEVSVFIHLLPELFVNES